MAKSKKNVLEELARVRFIGEKMAELLYDDHGARSIADIVALGDDGELTKLQGVGKKKAATILSSAKQLAKADGTSGTEAAKSKPKPKPAAKPKPKPKSKPAAKSKPKPKPAAKPKPKPKPAAKDSSRAESGNGAVPADRPSAGPNGRPPSISAAAAAPGQTSGGVGRAEVTTSVRVTTDDRSLRQRFIDTLRCPACGHDRFEFGTSTLTCQACQRQFDFQNDIADLAPPATSHASLTQKVMESSLYSFFYEDLARPRLTSLVSKRTMRDEYRLAAEFLELDGDDLRLLDVGCGTGNFTRYFAQRIGLAEARPDQQGLPLVTGMDLSWPMLETAVRNIRQENLEGKIFLVRGDATRTPLRRGAYNRLHCAGSLHLMNDIDESLRNFARVLEPQGICVIGTFILGPGILRRLAKRLAEFPTRFHWFSRDELHRRVERAGFEILDDSVAGDAITIKARRI